MKIRISDLFDEPAAKTGAIRLREDPDIDVDRIRQAVWRKLERPEEAERPEHPRSTARKRASMKALAIVAAAAALLTSAFAANAATGGKLFGAVALTGDNRYLAEQPNVAGMRQIAPGETLKPDDRRLAESAILSEEQLEDPLVRDSYVASVAVEAKGRSFRIPEVLTANGNIVIFTKGEEVGWQLNKGEQLTLHYGLDLKTNADSDETGERMEVGYVHDGRLVQGYSAKAKQFDYTLTADEAGAYYFYIRNASAGKIIVSSGTIR